MPTYLSYAQYKYQLKKWKLAKKIPAKKKQKMLDIYQQRKSIGKSTRFKKGSNLVGKKLERYIKSTAIGTSTAVGNSPQATAGGGPGLFPSSPFGDFA